MVVVRVSETYDLSTQVDKMGIVGIHTPTGTLIDKLWPGLVLQYKKFRFVKCDVAMACASMLPADPLQIGQEAGSIAPQDMFNPILYKAVSNETMNQFLAFMNYATSTQGVPDQFHAGSVDSINNVGFQSFGGEQQDQFSMYYALLSDSDGWRKAMPQAGLTMGGLYPLVYQVVSQFGQGVLLPDPANEKGTLPVDGGLSFNTGDRPSDDPVSTDGVTENVPDRFFRGPSMRMPSIATTVFSTSGSGIPGFTLGELAYVSSNTSKVPPAYVGLIILPPARLNRLYYRLKVTWTVEFSNLRSTADIASWSALGSVIGPSAYGTDYSEQSSAMTAKTAMVDSACADITKIMEGA